MKALILTEGGANIGFGHIARCLALGQAFSERGVTPRFLINGNIDINGTLKDKNYRIFDWIKEKRELQRLLQGTEVVVIDSYLADLDFYMAISKKAGIAVYLDDNMRINYPEGILINGNIYAEELNFPKQNGILYLLGRRYSLLRKAFSGLPRKIINKSVKEIMVTLGGDDTGGMTSVILQLLTKNYPDLIKKVVLGKVFSNPGKIEKLKDSRTELIYGPDAAVMKQLMLDADIAISSGGQTICELACLGVPTVGFSAVDNQAANVNAWVKLGFLEPIPGKKDSDFGSYLLNSLKRLHSFCLRKSRSLIGRRLIDGKGALNAVDKILGYARRKRGD